MAGKTVTGAGKGGGGGSRRDVQNDGNLLVTQALRAVENRLARGMAEYAALLATALTPAQAAQRIGVDVSRVRHRLVAWTLYRIKTPD